MNSTNTPPYNFSGTDPYVPLADLISEDEASRIGAFVTVEVRRQYDGPYDVGFMMHAWISALHDKENGIDLSIPMIVNWGKMIDPGANYGSQTFRTGPIFIGWDKKEAINLDRQMENWLQAVNDNYYATNDYAYKAFEDIHPFWDGNGRTGKIIFNWLNNTLRTPTWPYNFWGIENP